MIFIALFLILLPRFALWSETTFLHTLMPILIKMSKNVQYLKPNVCSDKHKKQVQQKQVHIMKKLFDFIFCDGVISTDTVFYLVKIGESQKDRNAASYVKRTAKTCDYFFARHDNDTQRFIDRCEESIYHGTKNHRAANYLRKKMVPITWLATFLRRYPPQLLNSWKIDTEIAAVK